MHENLNVEDCGRLRETCSIPATAACSAVDLGKVTARRERLGTGAGAWAAQAAWRIALCQSLRDLVVTLVGRVVGGLSSIAAILEQDYSLARPGHQYLGKGRRRGLERPAGHWLRDGAASLRCWETGHGHR